MLSRRRVLILTVPFVAVVAAAAYNYSVRPVYDGTAILSIRENVPGLPAHRRFSDPLRMQEVMDQEAGLIRSVEFASDVIGQIGDPERAELSGGSVHDWRQRLRFGADSVGIPTASLPMATAVEALRSRLITTSEEGSSWIEVRVAGYDPIAVAGLANAVAQTYVRQTADASRESVEASRLALEEQLESRQKELGQQLSGLVDLGGQAGLPRKTILERQIQSFQEALVAARTERVGRAATRREMAQLEAGALVASANPRIQAAQDRLSALEDQEKGLLASLGALHPDVVTIREQIETTRSRLAAATQAEISAAKAGFNLALREESRIEANLYRTQAELQGLQKKSVDYTISKRQSDLDELAMEGLMRQQRVAAQVATIEAAVVQSAVRPSSPSSPQKRRNLGYALLGGFFGAVLLAWLLERFNDSIQSPEDVKEILGLPFLGIVPLVSKLTIQALRPAVKDVRTGFADSLRVIRTNLMYGTAALRPKVLVITSASPGEGKSTLASGLAVLLRETGARVLLMDGDLRRPSVHTILGISSRAGLSDLLAQPAPVELVVTHDASTGIDVLSAGPSQIVSAAQLGSDNMKSLLAQARELYDWVIIDSPPSLGLPDAAVLATLADATVVVCSGDRTPRQALRSVADQLRTVGAHLKGVVLNRVDLKRHSYYYGRYYSPYYGSAEGKGSSPPQRKARPDPGYGKDALAAGARSIGEPDSTSAGRPRGVG